MRTFVVTGASSCGKTTVINELAKRGHPVLHEVARELIVEGKFAPRTAAFQNELALRHLAREEALRKTVAPLCFLDRGTHDIAAFSRHFALAVPPALAVNKKDYDAVFILDSLNGFRSDGIRIESDLAEALRIKDLIRKEYEHHGIPCITVPTMSVAERADFILRHAQSAIETSGTTAV